jgi:saccharopine dehydrogenase-like NADP-dependent oxidoreductase
MRVLVIGATGFFGRLLCEQLAREPGIDLILGGRTAKSLDRLGRALDHSCTCAVLDRNQIASGDLRGLEVNLVIDAAGPFQRSRTSVVEAAIGAGCHYLDLADARDFVTGISRFDTAARANDVAVLSGASSTPALSHAVLDELTRDWRQIDSIRIGIAPVLRALSGASLLRGVLGYAGRPVRVFRDGAWTTATGLGAVTRHHLTGLGARSFSLCETPDLDLLVSRYRPRITAEFLAGNEFGFLQRALSWGAGLVRRGWLPSLAPLAPIIGAVARLMAPLGSDRGGMFVEVTGRNDGDVPQCVQWNLASPAGCGPQVPTLAALLLTRRLRDGALTFRGASACVGHLSLETFQAEFDRFGLTTEIERSGLPAPVFVEALGPALFTLDPVTQDIHQPEPTLLYAGVTDVEETESRLGRWFAGLFGLPESARNVPVRVVIEARPDGTERWTRHYPTRVMQSSFADADPDSCTIEERFGHFRFRLRLDPVADGLALVPLAGWWHGLQLPSFLIPRVSARESANGRNHLFDVSIALPLIGRLVRYHGALLPERGQPCGDFGEDDDQRHQGHGAKHEGDRGHADFAERGALGRDPLHHEQQEAKWRCGEADLETQQDDHPEPDRIEAELVGKRKEDRYGQQHHRQLIHEHAQHQQNAEHDQQHHIG